MASGSNNKWGRMESEMDRFEAEISTLSKTTPSPAGPQLPSGIVPGSSGTMSAASFLPASLRKPQLPQIPGSTAVRPTLFKPAVIISGAPQVYGAPSPNRTQTPTLRPTQLIPKTVRPSLIQGAPQITASLNHSHMSPSAAATSSTESGSVPATHTSPSNNHNQTPGSSSGPSSSTNTPVKTVTKKKKKKQKEGATEGGGSKGPKKVLRAAGGTVWEDPTLLDWDPKDFRLFCGDLGNDVTDEVLTRVFGRYPSFVKAKVVRDKRTNKTRGYGFVSFKDPNDFVRAIRELDGRYVGSRPIKLRKSTWDARSLTQVRKREKHQKQLLGLIKP